MSQAEECIFDTLRIIIERIREIESSKTECNNQIAEAFRVAQLQALVEVLHTWKNQLQTFGVDVNLGTAWTETCAVLSRHGYL